GPNRPDGIYVIRFRNTKDGPRWKKFLRGYGFQGGSSINFNLRAAGFGEAYKKGVLDPEIALGLGGFGECLARWDNYVEVDPDVKNLFVMDASGFPSSACQNPTLTITALAVRSCDYLMDEVKRGNV